MRPICRSPYSVSVLPVCMFFKIKDNKKYAFKWSFSKTPPMLQYIICTYVYSLHVTPSSKAGCLLGVVQRAPICQTVDSSMACVNWNAVSSAPVCMLFFYFPVRCRCAVRCLPQGLLWMVPCWWKLVPSPQDSAVTVARQEARADFHVISLQWNCVVGVD